FGQNTPAIGATEAQYGEMWAQDAAAMYGYAASSAATTAKVTPFTAAPQTTSMAGLAAQATAGAQATGTSAGTGVQSTLSQLISSVQTALQNLASPLSSALSGSSSSGSVSNPFGGSSSASGFSLGGIASNLLSSYGAMPGWLGISMTTSLSTAALGPLMNPDVFVPFMQMNAAAAAAAAGAGASGATAALGSGVGGATSLAPGMAGLGQAVEIGGLSVPATWGWAAAGPGAMFGSAPMGVLAPAGAASLDAGAGFGFPFMFPGMGRGA